jgi:hypothetical protein
MKPIPTKSENPKGLHQRYYVEKVDGEPIDPKAEYFILRLDNYGSDPKHIAACRKAIITYAKEIKNHLPKLSKDLIERYASNLLPVEQPTKAEMLRFAEWLVEDGSFYRHHGVWLNIQIPGAHAIEDIFDYWKTKIDKVKP